jgi:hypothetical protein
MHQKHWHHTLLVLIAALIVALAFMALPAAVDGQGSAHAPAAVAADAFGKLIIENGTGLNAQVKLLNVSTHHVVFNVNVLAHHNRTITGIADGTYALAFWLGTPTNGFGKKFLNTLHFQTIRTGQGIKYTVYTVTLHAVVGGNAPTQGISRSAFNSF